MALSGAKSEQANLGQFGSIFTDGTGAVVAPSEYIICAITVLDDATFTTLAVENNASGSRVFANRTNPAHASDNGSEGSGGITIASTDVFPTGVTVFGRYTGFTLAGGSVIAYLAPKH